MPGCCAFACSNRDNKGYKMYKFPADPKRRKIWENKVNRSEWKPTSGSYLCQVHFDENQFETNRADGKKKLKWQAIPTIFTHQRAAKPRKSPKPRPCAPAAESGPSRPRPHDDHSYFITSADKATETSNSSVRLNRGTSVALVRAHSTTASLRQGVPGSVWKLGRLNHIAIAVPNMEKATALYRDVLGATVSDMVPLPEHGVYTVFVELGNTKLELLHPLGEKSPIAGFLQKNKSGGMHHICIEVDNINAAIADLKAKSIRTLSAEPRIGAHGKPVMFLHPKDCDGVLVELEEA